MARADMTNDETFRAMEAELTGSSDRAAAIVGGAYVEEALAEAMERHFIDRPKVMSSLLQPSGILGSFKAKIDLALMTGLVSSIIYRDLTLVKDIRNNFAHKLDVLSFEDNDIKSKAMSLKTGSEFSKLNELVLKSPDGPRNRFVFAVEWLVLTILERRGASPIRLHAYEAFGEDKDTAQSK